jgi:hypothetical protein
MTTATTWTACLLSLLCLLGGATAAPAQTSAEGTMRGSVRDQQGGVLPGVTIAATSVTTAGAATAVSEADGSYRLLGLAPGEYTVTADLAGFATYVRRGILVRAGLNLGLEIALAIDTLHEAVQVVAESPMLEVHEPVQAVNISGELQRSVPLSSRKDFTDFLEVTPGVTARTLDQGNGAQVYMLRGSDIDNHVIQIDGSDIGSFRQGLAGQYVGLSSEAIQDTQVKTGGVDAAAPLGVGLIVNVATPTGTNRVSGSVATVFQAQAWNGNNAAANGQSATSSLFQPDLALGGPIIPNRVTFFGSFRYADRHVGIARTADQQRALSTIDPAFVPFDNGGRSRYLFVKATTQMAPNQQLYIFFQRDFNPEVAAFPTDARPFNISAFGGNAVAARWSSIWRSAMTMRVLAAYNDKSFNGTSDAFDGHRFSGPEQDTYSSSFVSGGRRIGSGLLGTFTNVASLTVAPTSKVSVQADLAYFARGGIGSHELQFGILAQPRLVNETRVTYANAGAALEQRALIDPNDLASGTITFMRRVYDAATITSSSRVAQDWGAYVADAWKPWGRATITVGVRVDRILVDDRLYRTRVQDSVEIGPRIGATYVMTRDERNVLRVNYGRMADLPQPTYLPSAGGNPVGYTDSYDTNLDGVFETSLRSVPITPEKSNLRVDPARHQPWVDEWIAGYRRQWPGQLQMDASFVWRAYRDRPAVVEINRRYDGVRFVGYQDESLNDIYFVTNNTWNTQVYSGLELTVTKKTSRVNLIGGYTRGFQHLDGTWIPGDPAAIIQPSAFPNDKGIGSIRGNEPDSLSGTADTRSPSWQKHALRLGGSYNAPWNLVLASNLVLLSGPYSGPIVTRIAAPDPQFGSPIVTLSNGRQVSNPLATTIRFAYPTRGDGQIKAPTLMVWNVRVGRQVPVAGRHVHLALDLFNVTNHAADQQFQTGGNQLYNTTNYAIASDGTFRGQSRQPPRSAEISVRVQF